MTRTFCGNALNLAIIAHPHLGGTQMELYVRVSLILLVVTAVILLYTNWYCGHELDGGAVFESTGNS